MLPNIPLHIVIGKDIYRNALQKVPHKVSAQNTVKKMQSKTTETKCSSKSYRTEMLPETRF